MKCKAAEAKLDATLKFLEEETKLAVNLSQYDDVIFYYIILLYFHRFSWGKIHENDRSHAMVITIITSPLSQVPQKLTKNVKNYPPLDHGGQEKPSKMIDHMSWLYQLTPVQWPFKNAYWNQKHQQLHKNLFLILEMLNKNIYISS